MTVGKKVAKKVVALATTPEPSDGQKAQIEVAKAWIKERFKAIRCSPPYEAKGDAIGHGHSDLSGFWHQRGYALGSTSLDFAEGVEHALSNGPGLQGEGVTIQHKVDALNEGMKFIASNNPQSEAETMILLQIWLTHVAAIGQIRRMAAAGTISLLEAHGAIAAKLGNLNVRYWETFAKVRSAGKQVIEVQHVYVYPGGQAVVGTVNNTGGADAGIAGQPHAITYAPGETVPCQDPEREAVPVARDQGEAKVSDAREPGRRSEG